MARRRIAVIGLGLALTPHAKSLVDLQDRVEVAAGFSYEDAHRKAWTEKYGFPATDDLDGIFADKSIDTVMVLTPATTHYDVVKRAAAAGKNVLVEKPLDVTYARARELVDTCRRAGVTFGVCLQHRYRPSGRKLAAMIAEGELGRIVCASAHARMWRPQAYYDEPGRGTLARDGGGVLLTQAIHTLDIMLYLCGPFESVHGLAATTPIHRMETEDLVCGTIRFANGALGVIEATTAAYPGYPETVEIIAEKGCATVAGTALSVRFHDGRVLDIASDQTSGGAGANPMDFPHDYHRDLITDFLDAIEAKREPNVSGIKALEVIRLIDALLGKL
jgi:predicted dehydrogenase